MYNIDLDGRLPSKSDHFQAHKGKSLYLTDANIHALVPGDEGDARAAFSIIFRMPIMTDEAFPPIGTSVSRSYRNLVTLQRPQYGLTDDVRAARCDSIAETTTVLMRHPAESLDDIACKLAVLCDRLRAEGDVVSENGRLTLLIAEAARADAARLAVWVGGGDRL